MFQNFNDYQKIFFVIITNFLSINLFSHKILWREIILQICNSRVNKNVSTDLNRNIPDVIYFNTCSKFNDPPELSTAVREIHLVRECVIYRLSQKTKTPIKNKGPKDGNGKPLRLHLLPQRSQRTSSRDNGIPGRKDQG